MHTIETLQQLRAILGEPSSAVKAKIHPALSATARAFIAQSPLLLLSTCGSDGMPTVSPKGDEPGFVTAADDTTLLLPERKGNRMVISLQNILQNPKVGLIFLIPGTGETLRVQGTASLSNDPVLCDRLSARGQRALLVMSIRVQASYFHCARSLLRAGVWRPETWPPEMKISFGEEIAQRGGLAREDIARFDAAIDLCYKTDL